MLSMDTRNDGLHWLPADEPCFYNESPENGEQVGVHEHTWN